MKQTCVARSTPWGTIQIGPAFQHLTPLEQEAVLAHERGHVAHRHALKRLWWIVSLRAVFNFDGFLALCEQQEFEADRYAAELGHRAGLAAFLASRIWEPKSAGYPSARERLEAIRG
jgi:Zn-dependent protease with chaperone function